MTQEHEVSAFSPTVFIPNTLHANKITGELRSHYGTHVRRNGCGFLCKLSITACWLLPNLNVPTDFSTAPNTKFTYRNEESKLRISTNFEWE
jgi:hypothetical protein